MASCHRAQAASGDTAVTLWTITVTCHRLHQTTVIWSTHHTGRWPNSHVHRVFMNKNVNVQFHILFYILLYWWLVVVSWHRNKKVDTDELIPWIFVWEWLYLFVKTHALGAVCQWKCLDTKLSEIHCVVMLKLEEPHCPACRTTFIATRFRVAVICPIIPVPHCIRVFFYFVWFVFINHIFQFYYELCTYCNILDIYLS